MEVTIKKMEEMTPFEVFDIYSLRCGVFVVEQNCVYKDPDEIDKEAYHVLLRDGEELVAYLRVIPSEITGDGVLMGRVIAAKRRQGLGRQVVTAGMRVAKEILGAKEVYVKAQEHAEEFYHKCGFRTISERFYIDEIPHVKMVADL